MVFIDLKDQGLGRKQLASSIKFAIPTLSFLRDTHVCIQNPISGQNPIEPNMCIFKLIYNY